MSRIVIASGGTGGHFYPGYVLALELRKRGHEVLVVVRTDDPALPRLEAADIPSLAVDVTGMPRGLSPALVGFSWKMARAVGLLSRAIGSFRPDAVVGMGAYVSFPAVLAARLRGVPVMIHDSNTRLGLANRVSVPFAGVVCMGLPPAGGPNGAVLTGTPVREALWLRSDRAGARKALGLKPDALTILVFGGSQGAARLNALAPGAVARASASLKTPVQVLHLTGRGNGPAVEAAHHAAGNSAVVLEYLEKMELAFGAADLALCRSGASTVAELLQQGLPALLVPFPRAAGDHQTENARAFVSAGCGRFTPEAGLDDDSLARQLAEMLGDATGLEAMRAACAQVPVPRGRAAVDALAAQVEGLIR